MINLSLLHFLLSLFPTAVTDMGKSRDFFSNFSQMLKKGLLSCSHPGAEGCGMRDEVVVGLSLPLPQLAVPTDGVEVARGLLDSAPDSQHEKV